LGKTQMMLVTAVETLDEEKVVRLVKMGLQRGVDPLDIIEDVRHGMERVGNLYEQEKYYIADLIMASLIFQRVLTIIPIAQSKKGLKPQVVIGTVEGDIHDIGKNLTAGLLRARGVGVVDLGVDVPPQEFFNALQETGAKILGLSGLLTSSYEVMRKTVSALTDAGLRSEVQIMIGGLVNEDVQQHVGADHWIIDCAKGVELCQQILGMGVNTYTESAVNVI
jgi:methylmalonyl-CoA mutase cobalamin-binding domain/chain